jgi:molecular chaperone DnaK
VELGRGFFVAIVEKGTTLPVRRSRTFTTMSEEQSRAEIHVLRNLRGRERYETLGRLALPDIPAAPDGVPHIEVAFAIDARGTLSVTARAGTSGATAALVVEAGAPGVECALSLAAPDSVEPEGLAPLPAPPERGEAASRGDAEQDERLGKAFAEARMRLDTLVASSLRLVQTFESKLTADELRDVLAAIEGAQHARKADDFALVRAYLGELEKAAATLRQAMRRP